MNKWLMVWNLGLTIALMVIWIAFAQHLEADKTEKMLAAGLKLGESGAETISEYQLTLELDSLNRQIQGLKTVSLDMASRLDNIEAFLSR